MKKKFSTIKNIILLIASAVTLVAVTFAWYSVADQSVVSSFDSNVAGSTLAVKYYKSSNGSDFTETKEDFNMVNMYAGSESYYRMDVTTFKNSPIKLVMSFDNLSASNALANYVYFDYRVVCKGTGAVVAQGSNQKMADFAARNVFAANVYTYQNQGYNEFSVYYTVRVVGGQGSLPQGTVQLGEVKLLGQQA